MTTTKRSNLIPGDEGNYGWGVCFDRDRKDGYLGITQYHDAAPPERVLLSPTQAQALMAFYEPAIDSGISPKEINAIYERGRQSALHPQPHPMDELMVSAGEGM